MESDFSEADVTLVNDVNLNEALLEKYEAYLQSNGCSESGSPVDFQPIVWSNRSKTGCEENYLDLLQAKALTLKDFKGDSNNLKLKLLKTSNNVLENISDIQIEESFDFTNCTPKQLLDYIVKLENMVTQLSDEIPKSVTGKLENNVNAMIKSLDNTDVTSLSESKPKPHIEKCFTLFKSIDNYHKLIVEKVQRIRNLSKDTEEFVNTLKLYSSLPKNNN